AASRFSSYSSPRVFESGLCFDLLLSSSSSELEAYFERANSLCLRDMSSLICDIAAFLRGMCSLLQQQSAYSWKCYTYLFFVHVLQLRRIWSSLSRMAMLFDLEL
ncbi:unnamed protein product, partial [Cercospora beticola]